MALLEREARFLCMQRSTLELETLLSDFFQREWAGMEERARMKFLTILRCEDIELERYLFKGLPPPENLDRELIDRLKNYSSR